MWVKMDKDQEVKILDDLITRHKKTQMMYLSGESIVAVGLSLFFSWFLLFPNKLFQNREIPSVGKILLYLILVFCIIEVILLLANGWDYYRFKKLNHEEKREYYRKSLKKQQNKLCIQCGIIYKQSETKCLKCNSKLEMSYDYFWVEDSEGANPVQGE